MRESAGLDTREATVREATVRDTPSREAARHEPTERERPSRRADVLIVVGAFPCDAVRPSVGGGILTDCDALLEAGLGERFALRLIDSSKPMTAAPSLPADALAAARRLAALLGLLLRRPRPAGALIFVSDTLSFIEKGVMALLCKAFGLTVLLAPRGGAVRDHAMRHAPLRALMRRVVRASDRVLCQGDAWAAWFTELGGRGAPHVVPMRNWTASEPLLAIGQRRVARAGVPATRDAARPAPLRVLYLGALLRAKGVFELLEAARMAIGRGAPIELVVAGEGPDGDALRSRAATLGIASQVRFAGWVGGERKLQLLEDADAFCLPSHAEGLPNALIEAMACALPAIVTPVGAVREVATHERTALLVPVGDVEQLAQAMERLARDRALRERLGTDAYEIARADLSARYAVDRIVQLFLEARTPAQAS